MAEPATTAGLSDSAEAAALPTAGKAALEAVVEALRQAWPQAMAIYAFGSQVKGQARADSDLDLAILLPGYAAPLQLWNTAQQLAGICGCAVDLLDLRAASTVMQHQVLTQGLRLWAQGPQAEAFELYVLSEKCALDEARAPLLQDIQSRGSVYGR